MTFRSELPGSSPSLLLHEEYFILHHAACRGSTIWRLICVAQESPVIADFTRL